jgi:hypothetical protein
VIDDVRRGWGSAARPLEMDARILRFEDDTPLESDGWLVATLTRSRLPTLSGRS